MSGLGIRIDERRKNTLVGAGILSRLGAEYFLKADSKNFTLPKNAVLAWEGDDRLPKNP
ncbi:MAG TPA: hypothetical protein VI756_09535 [Blastocatellia bacterium]